MCFDSGTASLQFEHNSVSSSDILIQLLIMKNTNQFDSNQYQNLNENYEKRELTEFDSQMF